MKGNKSGRSAVWAALGAFFVGLGAVGVVVPLLPTTPFLLLAAACFARGSPRAHLWLMKNRYLGPSLRNYGEGRGLSKKGKVVSLGALYSAMGMTAFLTSPSILLALLLLVVTVAVTLHILTLKTADPACQ